MSFRERLNNGWKLTDSSFSILKKNKQLILFPIISGISLVLVIVSFVVGMHLIKGWDFKGFETDRSSPGHYVVLFLFYFVNYFIIVFFNMGLIHCTRLYFQGEEPTVRKGINFSFSRISVIFTWAIFAATVGTILKAIQDKVGFLGKIIVGLVGIVWSISTFFVMPVIAYEELGPIDAVKRSASLMKQKWGETLTATFSFGAVQFLAIFAAILPLWLIGAFISIPVAVTIGIVYLLALMAIMSAVKTIFIAAVYETMNDRPVKEFESAGLNTLFIQK